MDVQLFGVQHLALWLSSGSVHIALHSNSRQGDFYSYLWIIHILISFYTEHIVGLHIFDSNGLQFGPSDALDGRLFVPRDHGTR